MFGKAFIYKGQTFRFGFATSSFIFLSRDLFRICRELSKATRGIFCTASEAGQDECLFSAASLEILLLSKIVFCPFSPRRYIFCWLSSNFFFEGRHFFPLALSSVGF